MDLDGFERGSVPVIVAATGVGIISVGVVSIISGLLVDKTEWYVGGDQKTVDNIEDLYHSIRTQHNLD